MDLIGVQLGSYRVTGVLGRGGMGEVYVAEHQLIGRRAAIKVLRADLSRDQDTVQRFFNEARAATMIRHPGIVEIYDFGHAGDGSAFLVMELLEGESLATRLSREGALRVPPAMSIARQIASAIAAAHDKGIVHRDLKPDNVFLVGNAEAPFGVSAKILDFGIAKLHGDAAGAVAATQTGALLGTPLYMSPEQCRGLGDIDHRADLYALGCILFHMIAGRPPFLGAGVGDVIGAHIHVEPPSLRAFAPGAPAVLEQLVGGLLAKDRARRPASMAQVARTLEQALATPQLRDEVAATAPATAAIALDATLDPSAAGVAATAAPSATTPGGAVTRPDPTPVQPLLPPAITTLGGGAGERVEPARPSRRSVLLGLGGLAAVGGAGGLYLALRGGATTVRQTSKLIVEFDRDADLTAATLRPTEGRVAFAASELVRRVSAPGELAVLVLIQGTERFLGDDAYVDDSDDDRLVGVLPAVEQTLGAVTSSFPGAEIAAATYGIGLQSLDLAGTSHFLGDGQRFRKRFAVDVAKALAAAKLQLADMDARRKELLILCDAADFPRSALRGRAPLEEEKVATTVFAWASTHFGVNDPLGSEKGVTMFSDAGALHPHVARFTANRSMRWRASFEIDPGAASNGTWALSVPDDDGLETQVGTFALRAGEAHYIVGDVDDDVW